MTAAGSGFRYRLRSLFLVMTVACATAWTGRIFCFQQQARFHHRQVERHVRESEKMFFAGRPYSRDRWDAIRDQLMLACVYDHASCHPWLTLADAQAQMEQSRVTTSPAGHTR